MPQVKLLVNVGFLDQEKYGLPDEVVNNEGAVVDVSERVFGVLVDTLKVGRSPTDKDSEAEVALGRPLGGPPAGIADDREGEKASVSEEKEVKSPVVNETVDQAKATIDGMRSKEKVQLIIDHDSRVTVVEHARKKLASM